MADLYETLFALLDGHASLAGVNVVLGSVQQGGLTPALEILMVGGSEWSSHDGPSGVFVDRFQFVGVHEDFILAKKVRNDLRLVIFGLLGSVDTEILAVEPIGGKRDFKDEVTGRWKCQQDYRITYRDPNEA